MISYQYFQFKCILILYLKYSIYRTTSLIFQFDINIFTAGSPIFYLHENVWNFQRKCYHLIWILREIRLLSLTSSLENHLWCKTQNLIIQSLLLYSNLKYLYSGRTLKLCMTLLCLYSWILSISGCSNTYYIKLGLHTYLWCITTCSHWNNCIWSQYLLQLNLNHRSVE